MAGLFVLAHGGCCHQTLGHTVQLAWVAVRAAATCTLTSATNKIKTKRIDERE
jgi:hypothetical protein